MRHPVIYTVAAFLSALLLISPQAKSSEKKIALLPLKNLAGINPSKVDYLFDIIRGTAVQHTKSLKSTLIPDSLIQEAVNRTPGGMKKCNEACATSLGRDLKANLVILGEIRRLDKELRLTLKLLDTKAGELKGMERLGGARITDLENPLEQAVHKIFGGGEKPVATGKPAALNPGQSKPYYGNLTVTAMGKKEGDKSGPLTPIEAEVFINGKKVGTTPFEDGLPEGTYQLEIRYGREATQKEQISVIPGRAQQFEAQLTIPMTKEERKAIQEKRRQEEQAEQEMLKDKWREDHNIWKAEATPLKEKRRPLLISGIVLISSGAALILTGGILEANAKEKDSEANSYQTDWKRETDESVRDSLASKIKDAQDSRDVSHATGLSFLAIGGAAFVSSIVLFIVMPSIPEEPNPPEGLGYFNVSSLRLAPMLGPKSQGASLSLKF